MSRPTVTRRALPLPVLEDVRFTKGHKALLLFVNDNGRRYVQRVDLTRHRAGLFCVTEQYGVLHFVRGVKVPPRNGERGFSRVLRTSCGMFTARRELAEALVFLLWGQKLTLSEWPEGEA